MKKNHKAGSGMRTNHQACQVNRIPLKERLERIKSGQVSDPQCVVEMIRSFAHMPICDYMKFFEMENEQLRYILDISEAEEAEMTYRDVAVKVKNLFMSAESKKKEDAAAAMELLAAPFEQYSREHYLGR